MNKLAYKSLNGVRAVRRWVIPYINSRVHSGEFRPVLCYMYTDWTCNIDCHYCFQFANGRPGMNLETARSSIDFLKSVGCRVVPIMGGEPLVRPDFVIELIRYGARNGFFMYLPTNGYLLTEEIVEAIGAAGVAAVNLAVDCVFPKRGLPKCLAKIEKQFRLLVEAKDRYGFLVFFNINICRNNLQDVRLLTEIARANRIGTDYHLNEPPQKMVNVDHWKHGDDGLYITEDQIPAVEALLDWIKSKQKLGWPMVNSIRHLENFKEQLNGRPMKPWICRAGRNGAMIRPDGSLAPCFGMLSHDHDWGRIWEPKWDEEALAALKKECSPWCSSTCFHTMDSYYGRGALAEWVRKHVRVG